MMVQGTTEDRSQLSVTPATPTPWRVGDRSATRIVAGDDDTIATTACQSSLCDAWEANAAFIVRVVNSHDALVASLQQMLDIYWGDGDGELPEPRSITRAREALSAAGVTDQSSSNVSGEVNQ